MADIVAIPAAGIGLSGETLLTGFSKFVDDYFVSACSANGAADGSTLIDIALERFGDNELVGESVRMTQTGTNQYLVSTITSNTSSSGTIVISPPFTTATTQGDAYELHKYIPTKKFAAIDSARFPVADDVFRLVYDETLTTDGYSIEYPVPTTIQRPAVLFVERLPWSPLVTWNFIPSPQCDDGMKNWTFSAGVTAAVYTRQPQDRLVPKYGPACTLLNVGNGHQTATLSAAKFLTPLTPGTAGGRILTWAHWVYCTQQNELTLQVVDDTGLTIASSTMHQGLGWEFLSVTFTPVYSDTSTLNLVIDEASPGSLKAWVNNGWLYYGPVDMVKSQYFESIPFTLRRDNTTKKLIIREPIVERRQLRVVGKDILTALGTDPSAQTTNIMEVDETTAEIVYAKAAEILFQGERLSTQNFPQVQQRIQVARERLPDIRRSWEFTMPDHRLYSPYAR